MIVFAVLFAVLLGICLLVGLPGASRWQQTVAVAVFLLLTGVVYAGSVEMLGAPKPMRLEWRAPGQATVLAARMREGEAIYVWLQPGANSEPRSYVLPWNAQTAQQLQTAMQKGRNSGSPVHMVMPSSSGGDEGQPKFYAEPQRPLPDKDDPDGDTVIYRHPET